MLLITLDILGFIFGASGSLCVGLKKRIGFLLFILGSSSHGILGLMQGNYGLLATCTFFIIVDIYFYIQWGKDDIQAQNLDKKIPAVEQA